MIILPDDMAPPTPSTGVPPGNAAGSSTTLSNEDPFDLQRFVTAQAAVYKTALGELVAGSKRSHWIWFIFPQLQGLGRSDTAKFYGIKTRAEAVAYMHHPVLSGRLRECTRAMLRHPGKSALHVLGSPDDIKFHSSITLFNAVCPDDAAFIDALKLFFGGKPDGGTLSLLAA